MSPFKQIVIKLTGKQRRIISEEPGKEVPHITLRRVAGIVLLAEAPEARGSSATDLLLKEGNS